MVFSLTLSELLTQIMVAIGGFMYNIITPVFVLMMILAPLIILYRVIKNVFRPKKSFNY